MNSFPTVLVIIVTWNKKSYVVDLLQSLQRLTYPVQQLDVLVVDNASSDGTSEVLKRDFPGIHVIENRENLGGTGGFNTGLRYAFAQPEGKYDYLWLLDNDVQVHRNALAELVALLESEQDAAVAGSTMMQLTSPWRINEMGAFVDLHRGRLLLNRHREDVPGLEGKKLEELHNMDIDLSEYLEDCRPSMDVEYIAAASLLIRSRVAREAGVWDDYFIHYDDVDWCLRIARMGHRILVSARSLIWHLPAEYKVPTWILYYDNRNVQYLLEKHAPKNVRGLRRWIRKKSLYYMLLGKNDLARLHLEALADYRQRRTGKKDIALDNCYFSRAHVEELLHNDGIRRVLIPWTVDLEKSGLHDIIAAAMKKRSDLRVDCLVPPLFVEVALLCRLNGTGLIQLPGGKGTRWFNYIKLYNTYDLVFQSDYQPILPLNLAAKKILYVNYEGVGLRHRPTTKNIVRFIWSIGANGAVMADNTKI
ncbi:MAG: glycosyltransferase family 2 protein [Desulfobulbaceae bacterium]|nr:glycosyltransferase family 2 protein [Desulfobulbaceae bacterium]